MQEDEEIGKVAAGAPIVICEWARALDTRGFTEY